jgi:Core-2/I-Branching enzyme
MRKAYLITAYNQPEMLGRLVKALNTKEVFFFVHIDLKTDISPFLKSVKGFKNIKFVERTKVNWMGFSQVQSILTLMKEAATAQNFEYYSLISGSDYPIKSNQFILDFFADCRTEYISYWKISDRPSWWDKIEYYYLTDLFSIRDYYPKITLRGLYWRLFFRIKKYLPKKKQPNGLIPYGGSDWWSLTQDCVRFILNFANENQDFMKFYRYSLSPSDMFFQTIVMNSKFAESAKNYLEYNQWSLETSHEDKIKENKMLPEDSFNFRYIDWSSTWNDRGWPAFLDETDFEKLKASNDIFARKFDSKKSFKVLNLIDKELRNN